MNRSRNLVDFYYNRDVSLHKPGVIPNSSKIISPITAHRHKYELKQRIWPKKTIESWFANHSSEERQTVYSFLDTLYQADDDHQIQYRKSSSASRRISTSVSPRRSLPDSRASKRDLGEVLQTLKSFRTPLKSEEKSIQTSPINSLPTVNIKRPSTSNNQIESNEKSSQRYLSQTWRVINPRDDVEPNVRPDHNSSSFFNYTKKTYPEYFFIHPDWY